MRLHPLGCDLFCVVKTFKPMKIAILLGTAEYVVFNNTDSVSDVIRTKWEMDIKSTINRKYQQELTTECGYVIIVKPFNP
jgi:hypothetical protein